MLKLPDFFSEEEFGEAVEQYLFGWKNEFLRQYYSDALLNVRIKNLKRAQNAVELLSGKTPVKQLSVAVFPATPLNNTEDLLKNYEEQLSVFRLQVSNAVDIRVLIYLLEAFVVFQISWEECWLNHSRFWKLPEETANHPLFSQVRISHGTDAMALRSAWNMLRDRQPEMLTQNESSVVDDATKSAISTLKKECIRIRMAQKRRLENG